MDPNMRCPEIYYTKPNKHCPNSTLPVLVFRNAFPNDLTVESATAALDENGWFSGGVFKHYPTHHYHANTHEAYIAVAGHTKCLYGVGPLDDPADGITFEMKAGDCAVHAAGVAHKNLESSEDYMYIGAYPKGKVNHQVCRCYRNIEGLITVSRLTALDESLGQRGR